MKEHPLRSWRVERDLTLNEASKKLGISIAQLCEIELRQARPSAGRALSIMQATGLSLEQVLGK
jgi:transcriptional regulator with XRE-family HTH domain